MSDISYYSSDPSPNIKKERRKRGRPRKNKLLDYAIESKNIKGLKIGEDFFLCFNQLTESVLNHIPINTIHEACFILDVKYKQCNDSINKLMETVNAICSKKPQYNLIKIKDAERLCNFLLHKDNLSSVPCDRVPAFHDYFGGCEGTYISNMDVEPRSRCILCNRCSLILSAQRFLCHSHVLGIEKRDISSDPLNWDRFIFIQIRGKVYSLSCFRKWRSEIVLEDTSDLHNLLNEHQHSKSEQTSLTAKLDVILKDFSNFLRNANESPASANIISAKRKSRKRTPRKLKRPMIIKSSDMLYNVFSPALVQAVSGEDFEDPLKENSPTTVTSFDFSTTKSKRTNLSIEKIEQLDYSVNKIETFVFSATKRKSLDLLNSKDKPLEISVTETKPLDLSIKKNKSVDFPTTKAKQLEFSPTKDKSFDFSAYKAELLDFSATEIEPLDLSTTQFKPVELSITEAAYSLMKLLND